MTQTMCAPGASWQPFITFRALQSLPSPVHAAECALPRPCASCTWPLLMESDLVYAWPCITGSRCLLQWPRRVPHVSTPRELDETPGRELLHGADHAAEPWCQIDRPIGLDIPAGCPLMYACPSALCPHTLAQTWTAAPTLQHLQVQRVCPGRSGSHVGDFTL